MSKAKTLDKREKTEKRQTKTGRGVQSQEDTRTRREEEESEKKEDGTERGRKRGRRKEGERRRTKRSTIKGNTRGRGNASIEDIWGESRVKVIIIASYRS